MRFPWYVTAFAAALIWGFHYQLLDNALRRISVLSVLVLPAVLVLVVAPFFLRTLHADYVAWTAMTWRQRAPILAMTVTSLLGSVLLFVSIQSKNATLASLIEISYPIFVALFGYLLFRQIQFNASVVIGALLIFAGVALVILNNPR